MYFADTGAFGGTNNFGFFLPVDAVKEEKKYRACKDIRDVMKLLDKEEHRNNLVGTIIHIRHKITETTETALSVSVSTRGRAAFRIASLSL